MYTIALGHWSSHAQLVMLNKVLCPKDSPPGIWHARCTSWLSHNTLFVLYQDIIQLLVCWSLAFINIILFSILLNNRIIMYRMEMVYTQANLDSKHFPLWQDSTVTCLSQLKHNTFWETCQLGAGSYSMWLHNMTTVCYRTVLTIATRIVNNYLQNCKSF